MIFPTVLFLSVAPNLLIDEPIDEKPLLRSENPLVSALEGLLVFESLLQPLPPTLPTDRKPLVKAEVDLVKAESNTFPDLFVNSLAESNGFVTAVVKVRLERAGRRKIQSN